jgi:hypothetical protein
MKEKGPRVHLTHLFKCCFELGYALWSAFGRAGIKHVAMLCGVHSNVEALNMRLCFVECI